METQTYSNTRGERKQKNGGIQERKKHHKQLHLKNYCNGKLERARVVFKTRRRCNNNLALTTEGITTGFKNTKLLLLILKQSYNIL